MSRDEDIFSRWSSRKRAVAEESAPEEGLPDAPAPDTPADIQEGDEDEAVLLERLGLPVPESLGPGDDFSVFMQSGVPEFLRRRALRRLWRSNPVLVNIDGLNDYDEDFTSPEETMKVLKTAYKVGRGFLRDKSEDEANADQSEAPESAEQDASVAVDRSRDEVPKEQVETKVSTEMAEASDLREIDATAQETGKAAEDPGKGVARVKRMRFET